MVLKDSQKKVADGSMAKIALGESRRCSFATTSLFAPTDFPSLNAEGDHPFSATAAEYSETHSVIEENVPKRKEAEKLDIDA